MKFHCGEAGEEDQLPPPKMVGVSRSLISIVLYEHRTKPSLPINSLSEEFRVSRAREDLQYTESCDPKVSQAGMKRRSQRRGKPKRQWTSWKHNCNTECW